MDLIEERWEDNTRIGQFFTPSYVAEFMVKNSLKFINFNTKESHSFKVLEPSVGKGIFLRSLLKNGFKNIIAYETDHSFKQSLVKSYPNVEFRFSNFLGSDIGDKFDLIIGNPPYLGQNYNADIFQDYIKKYPICAKFFVGNMDLFYFFIHLGIEKLKPGGILSFITTNYWITKSSKTGIKYLKPDITSKCHLLQYIDLSNLNLFQNARGQHNCIFIIRKKTEHQVNNREDHEIEIMQIKNSQTMQMDEYFYKSAFKSIFLPNYNENIIKYNSALTNNKLSPNGSWNLLYPKNVAELVDKIEGDCVKNSQTTFLKDYFLIRNGLIFIKDEIFVLIPENNIILDDKRVFVKIENQFKEISNIEKSKLKKIYKSKAIKNFCYKSETFSGYGIFFNKDEFPQTSDVIRNDLLSNKYPILTQYIKQYKSELQAILKNAKENPEDYFFPRRGAYIWRFTKDDSKQLFNLEDSYDNGKKIFTRYISDTNIFGYSNDQYYATSDTYFLWPKYPDMNINYPLILAYLNSRLLTFLFKAKNVKIKRSKTKLENLIPIPNFEKLGSKRPEILNAIEILSQNMINQNSNGNHNNLIELNRIPKLIISELPQSLKSILNNPSNLHKFNNSNLTQELLDILMFKLFNISEKQVDYLINKYYPN